MSIAVGSGDENDAHARQAGILTQRSDQLQAVDPRHDDIKDREVGFDDGREREGLGARGGGVDIANVRKPALHERRDLRLIVQNKEDRTPSCRFCPRAG